MAALALSFCLSLGLTLQSSESYAGDDHTPDPADSSAAVTAQSLRQQIRAMRRSVLLGGDQVRQAEQEAVHFYQNKIDAVDQQLDTLQAELSEHRASYDLALKRSLEPNSTQTRQRAMQDAGSQRQALTHMEQEQNKLEHARTHLVKLVKAVDSRQRDRQKVIAQLETSQAIGPELGVPMAGIGLAPQGDHGNNPSPFDDPALIEDLLQRDPIGARRALFEADPQRYFQAFPLSPPTGALIKALPFPLPDLPGQR